jgi:hypothetical protein
VLLQAISAGRLLDGDSWARDAHRTVAGLLVCASVIGGLVALVRLREDAVGRRFGLILAALGVALVVQYGLGAAAADGKRTLWLHIPLGVVLFGLTMRLNVLAGREVRA